MAFDPQSLTFYGLQHSVYVRFSLLALSSILFLVDPFAALPTFLAITEGDDAARRKRIARKGALTALIVLSGFAFAGEEIFRLFGITLPAFELAGGIVLLLIGLDMLEAKRSATQEAAGDTAAAAQKRRCWDCSVWVPDAGGAGRDYVGDGAGGTGADALADGRDSDLDCADGADLLPGAGALQTL